MATEIDTEIGYQLRKEFIGDFKAHQESHKLNEITIHELNIALLQATYDITRGYKENHDCPDFDFARTCNSCYEMRGYALSAWHMAGLDWEHAETHYWNHKYH